MSTDLAVHPLLELFRSHGHDLKREGKNYKTCCPFHPDDTPSLSVNPSQGLWSCFGCGAGGDGITFLEKSLNITFGEAADIWRELSGEEPKHTRPNGSYKKGEGKPMNRVAQKVRAQKEPAPLTIKDIAVLGRLQDLYAQELGNSKEALAYLKERGITDFETIRAFGLGYVSGRGLPQMSEEETRHLQELGILNDKGNETFYRCIVCPLYDQSGNVVNFFARSVQSVGSSRSAPSHLSLPGSKSVNAAVHRQAARSSTQLVLVEGFLDALACYQAGVRNVMPVGGCVVRLDLVKLFQKHGVKEVVLALDPDEAGDEGSQAWAEVLESRGIGSVRVRLDWDPCEFFLRGGTASVFRRAVEKGQVLGRPAAESEFLLDSHGLLYRVRTLDGRQEDGKLKVQVLVSSVSNAQDSTRRAQHRDVLNLYSHKTRKTFVNAILSRFDSDCPELTANHIEDDLSRIIDGLEVRARQENEAREVDKTAEPMAPEEREAALQYLTEPGLVRRLLHDMESLGYVGEEEAKLLVYLIATSRKLPRPLSGIIGSGSGAGKSFLAELAEQLTPPEEVELFSKLSSQALYYLPKDYLCRKLLILEERAGGEGADYAIRTLQTKDKLTQAVVLKDPTTGRMTTRHYEVTGPIAYLETTTQSYLNPENTSRCFEIPLDESADQTRRIHESQRKARGVLGLKRTVSRTAVRRTHHNAQRILEQVRVVIPYAEALTFPDRYLRTRRDHERFLCLIEAVAFLHQFQRERGTAFVDGQDVPFIKATVEDYAIAYKLALRVLWVSLDELSRWGRELVDSCREQFEEARADNPDMAPTAVNWTRRQLREFLGWPDKRLRACLDELVSLEYLRILGGGKGKTFIYCLNPDFSHNPRALGLLTPEALALRAASLDEREKSP